MPCSCKRLAFTASYDTRCCCCCCSCATPAPVRCRALARRGCRRSCHLRMPEGLASNKRSCCWGGASWWRDEWASSTNQGKGSRNPPNPSSRAVRPSLFVLRSTPVQLGEICLLASLKPPLNSPAKAKLTAMAKTGTVPGRKRVPYFSICSGSV